MAPFLYQGMLHVSKTHKCKRLEHERGLWSIKLSLALFQGYNKRLREIFEEARYLKLTREPETTKEKKPLPRPEFESVEKCNQVLQAWLLLCWSLPACSLPPPAVNRQFTSKERLLGVGGMGVSPAAKPAAFWPQCGTCPAAEIIVVGAPTLGILTQVCVWGGGTRESATSMPKQWLSVGAVKQVP